MKRLTTVLVLLVFTVTMNAQTVDIATERGLMSKNISKKVDAEGSPYVDENFRPLKIDKYGNKIYTGRYNAYHDEMEVKLSDGKIVALDNSSDLEVTFTSDNKVYKTYSYTTENDYTKRGFLVVIEETETFSLMKREFVKYYEGQIGASHYQSDKPATFRRESDTYYAKMGDKIMFIPLKKKSFISAFPDHSSEIKKYIKDEKIKLKNEEDLIKILKYISEL